MTNLDAGLKIAKDGDIIFIEEGTYAGRTLRQQAGNMKLVLEISKSVTLVINFKQINLREFFKIPHIEAARDLVQNLNHCSVK